VKSLCTAALFLAVVLAGCDSPAKPFNLPDPAEVDSFDVTRWTGNGSFWERHEISTEYSITDRRRIAEILAFLKEHNTDYWHHELLPAPWNFDYTIHICYKNKSCDSFDLGEKWFGVAELDRWPIDSRERRISASERERLVELFAKEN
jgi:hypothetical protein